MFSLMFMPTETSQLTIDADINTFGLGMKLMFKDEVIAYNSIEFNFLFLTFALEWGIDAEQENAMMQQVMDKIIEIAQEQDQEDKDKKGD